MRDDLVPVAHFPLMPEAHMARSLLEAEGVHAVVGGEEATTAFAGLDFDSAGVQLYVRAEDADEAAALLAEAQSGHEEEEAPPLERGTWLCPECDTAVRDDRSRCPECDTPRSDFQTTSPLALRPMDAGDRPRVRVEGIQAGPPSPPAVEADPPPAAPAELQGDPIPPTPAGDELVYRALRVMLVSLFCLPFFPLVGLLVVPVGGYLLLRATFARDVPPPTHRALPWFLLAALVLLLMFGTYVAPLGILVLVW